MHLQTDKRNANDDDDDDKQQHSSGNHSRFSISLGANQS